MTTKHKKVNTQLTSFVNAIRSAILGGLIIGIAPGGALAEVHTAGLVTTAQTPIAVAGDVINKVALSGTPLLVEGVAPMTTTTRSRPEMSAAISPLDYALPQDQRVSGEGRGLAAFTANNSHAETTAKDEVFHMPYALVLVLVALIGLVPVSRRHR